MGGADLVEELPAVAGADQLDRAVPVAVAGRVQLGLGGLGQPGLVRLVHRLDVLAHLGRDLAVQLRQVLLDRRAGLVVRPEELRRPVRM